MPSEILSTPIPDVFELLSDPFVDSRGAFLNAYRAQDDVFMASWGDRDIAQVNLSRNDLLGTIRGLHFQAHPHSEAKLIRCLKGRVWDIAVDLRPDSSTFRKWYAVELTPKLCNALLVPEGCAHGFQVLEPGSELLYFHSGPWVPQSERGVRWDDPQLAITWPLHASELSERDRSLPSLSELLSNNHFSIS